MNTFELVVARYQEDLRWLRKVPGSFRKTVYDKSGEASDAVPLPNIGHESHTYLHHIVAHYDALEKLTVFCQGKPFDHVPDFHKVLRRLDKGDLAVQDFLWLGFIVDRDNRTGSLLFQDWKTNPDRSPLPMNELWNKLWNRQAPDEFVFYPGAHFVVSDACIRKQPRSFYEEALELSTTIPHVGHCFERCWDQVFGTDGIPPRFKNAKYPVYTRPIRRLGITWESLGISPGA